MTITDRGLPALSASRLDLAARCAGAFAHEHTGTTSDAGERGTAVHEYIAAVLKAEEPPLPNDEKAAALCASLDACELSEAARPTLEAPFYTEQALYLVPSSGDSGTLEGAYHRDYSGAPEGAAVGTADVVVVEEERVSVTDWKTGSREVPDPADNYQLRFLGLAAARAHGKGEALIRVVQIQADGDAIGSLTIREAALEADDLADTEHELAAIAARVQAARDGQPSYHPSSACRHCPAIARCPAISGAAQALLEGPPEELTPARAAELWERVQAVEAAAKAARESLREYVYARPVPTSGGRELKVSENRRERILPERALPVLRRYLPDDDVLAPVIKIDKSALYGAFGREAERELLHELRQEGAVEETYVESLKEGRASG